MLHLENFFEKSFALLLTTPIASFFVKKRMTIATFADILVIMSKIFRGNI